MRVVKEKDVGVVRRVVLLDDVGAPVEPVARFLDHVMDAGYSPRTVCAYGYDLGYLWLFLAGEGLDWREFRPPTALAFLGFLRRRPSRRPAQRLGLAVATSEGRLLAPATVQRVLAATSSFYEWAIAAGEYGEAENPLRRESDPALARVPDRHQPFVGAASRQRPVRRTVRVDDVAYGRQRVTVRKRDDHPHGARGKCRRERVVDLHRPRTLDAVSRYVLHERPVEAVSPFLFLVGGAGTRRDRPLSYQALARGFARRLDRLGIRSPEKTPHALRHTHATAMSKGGMRELALQRRLGHASPESTRIYTRVSDEQVPADYARALGSGA